MCSFLILYILITQRENLNMSTCPVLPLSFSQYHDLHANNIVSLTTLL